MPYNIDSQIVNLYHDAVPDTSPPISFSYSSSQLWTSFFYAACCCVIIADSWRLSSSTSFCSEWQTQTSTCFDGIGVCRRHGDHGMVFRLEGFETTIGSPETFVGSSTRLNERFPTSTIVGECHFVTATRIGYSWRNNAGSSAVQVGGDCCAIVRGFHFMASCGIFGTGQSRIVGTKGIYFRPLLDYDISSRSPIDKDYNQRRFQQGRRRWWIQ